MNVSWRIFLSLALFVGAATSANAQLLRLDFTSDGSGDATAFGGTNPPIGVEPGFTEFVVAELGPSNNVSTNPSLTESGTTFAITGNVSAWPGNVVSPSLLHNDYLFFNGALGTDASIGWEVSGLAANTLHTLTFYSAVSGAGRFIDFASQGQEFQISGGTNNIQALNLMSDSSGIISGTAANGNGSFEPNWAAFEIEEFVEPDVYADVDTITGEVVIRTSGALANSVLGYELKSAANIGALDVSEWTTIADNYDADSGPTGGVQVDTNDNWTALPSNTFSIAEAELNNPSGDGAQFGAGLEMSLGNVWIPHPFGEDLSLEILFDDGTVQDIDVLYNNIFTINQRVMGDFDGNGSVGTEDWPTVRDNSGGDHTGLSVAESYQLGDLNSDGVTNLVDVGLFRDQFNANLGAGAFEAFLSGANVPEPNSAAIGLLGLAFATAIGFRRKLQRASAGKLAVALFVGLALSSSKNCDAVELVINGDFEAPGGFTGSNDFVVPDDWTVGGRVLRWTEGYHFGVVPIPETGDTGNILVNLPNVGSAVSQTIPTVIGAEYTISYDYSVLINDQFVAENVPLDFNVNVGGTLGENVVDTESNFVFADTGQAPPALFPEVKSRSFMFTATNSMTTLQFISNINSSADDQGLLIDNVSFDGPALEFPDLRLEITRGTGQGALINSTGGPFTINGYEISSTTDALDPSVTGLTGGGQLPAANGDNGDGWEFLGANNGLPSISLIQEAFLAGSSEIPGDSTVFSLGSVYTGTTQADEDGITFSYWNATTNTLEEGIVHFVDPTGGLPGDFNGDQIVDAADYTVWRNNLGASDDSAILGNGDGVPGISPADYAVWKSNFGTSAIPGALQAPASVPEPTAIGLLSLGAICFVVGRFRSAKA